AAFPPHNAIACGLTALTGAFGGFGNQTDPEKFLVQLVPGNFVIKFVFNAMNGKDANHCFSVLCYYAFVRLRFSTLLTATAKPLTAASLLILASRRILCEISGCRIRCLRFKTLANVSMCSMRSWAKIIKCSAGQQCC